MAVAAHPGSVSRAARDRVGQDEAAENRRRLFGLLSEVFRVVPLTVTDLLTTLEIVLDRLDTAGARAPRGEGR